MHAISKLRYAQFHVVTIESSSYILSRIEYTETIKDQKTHQVAAYNRLKTIENHLTVSSATNWESFGVLYRRSRTRGGRTGRFDCSAFHAV